MSDEKPLLSIKNGKIEINLKEGDSIKTNADKTLVQGVKHNIEGGELEHQAKNELTQVGNEFKISKKGKMINEVREGVLKQTDNSIEVTDNGTIINKI